MLKSADFSIKISNEWKRHISLNSQFIVVFDGIICFSVRFYDNSLFVLKMRFQVFSFVSKKVQGFSSDRKILMSLLSLLFIYKTVSQFSEVLILAKIFRETFIMSLKSTSFLKELWKKPFPLPSKTNQEKSETRFCRRKTTKDNNAKINVSPNTPCNFLLFKASVFLQIFSPRNPLFRQVLRTSL